MSIEEASREQAAREKVDKSVATATRLGWRDAAKASERFVVEEKRGLHQWGSVFMPRKKNAALDIWRKLAPRDALGRLIEELNEAVDQTRHAASPFYQAERESQAKATGAS